MNTDTHDDSMVIGLDAVNMTSEVFLPPRERRWRQVTVTGKGTKPLFIRPTGFGDIKVPAFLPVGLMVCLTQAARKLLAWKQYVPNSYTNRLYEAFEVVTFGLEYPVRVTTTVEVKERVGPDSWMAVKVPCHCLNEWSFTAMLKVWYGTGVDEPMLRTLFEVAGKTIGIGVERPALGGTNGQFLLKQMTGFGEAPT